MRVRAAGVLLLGISLISLISRHDRSFAVAPGVPDDRYAIVQLAIPGPRLPAGEGIPPTLEELGFRHWRVPDGVPMEEYLASLRARPDILSAVADVTVYAAVTPNDEQYAANQATYATPIGLPAAWETTTGSKNVVVAILDTGIDVTHPDLVGRLWKNPGELDGDGIDNDHNDCVDDVYGCRFITLNEARRTACGYTNEAHTGDISDDNGRAGSLSHSHGTMVAGIVGAAGNNNIGIAGVAWDVRLMSVKVLDCGPGGAGEATGDLMDVARGIQYARRMGANIICLSLASASASAIYDLPVMREAIQAAQDQGIIIVAAAGNHAANNPGYPAAYTQYPNVVGVGAADNENGMRWATFSDYGPGLDFAAPGVNIASTTRVSLGSYGRNSGTSFAAPLVAGMFALMESRNSKLSATDLIQIAREAATPAQAAPHGGNWAGAGIINIGAALERVPLQLSGAALRDWKDVPAGTEVRALIDGKVCGTTRVATFATVARFSIRVDPAQVTPGCGVPGKVVRLSIDGVDVSGPAVWGGRDEDLGFPSRDYVAVSPPPGPTIVQTLNGGWSNVAHLDAPGKLPQALSYLPSGWTTAMIWDPAKPGRGVAGGFKMTVRNAPAFVSDWTDLATYEAYWVDAPAANVATLNPNPPPGRVVNLKPGWNNFVYTGENRQVSDVLGGIPGKYTQVLSYDNASKTWQFYTPGQPRYANDFAGLFKLKVYWIYVTEAVSVTF